jgi:hypothetical protein
MPLPPLRAVILDNDETTGSYMIVFAVLTILEHLNLTDVQIQKIIFKKLAYWMNTHHCFRPGLSTFLYTLITLRKQGRIDAIIMYTNQSDASPQPTQPSKGPNFLHSAAHVIAYMMSCLAGEQIFDHVLTRPKLTYKATPPPKFFSRVLELYPTYPADIREMAFIDDLANPSFIRADGIPSHAVHSKSWIQIEPYVRVLSDMELYHCCKFIFGSFEGMYDLYIPLLTYMTIHSPKARLSSSPKASTLTTLGLELQRRYGYVKRHPIRHVRDYILQPTIPKDLQDSLNITIHPYSEEYANRANQTSQTNSGASHGKCHDSE